MGLDPGTTGVIINLVIGGVTTALVVLVFDFLLRKRLSTVFEYRKYLHDERPDVTDYQGNRVAALPSPPSGFLGWMRGAWGVKLDENLERSHGLDQVMFLRFLRTQLVLCCAIGVIVAVLLPIYGTGPFKDLPEKDAEGYSTLKTLGIQIVTLSNISADDWRVWATLLADALIAGVVWLLVRRDIKGYADARRRYRSARDNPSNYAIVVMDIDEESCSESQVFEYWNRLFPGQVVSVHYVHGDAKLLKKKARFLDAVTRRERAEWGMANDPKLGGQRPTHKVGTCACCNRSAQEVDSIEHWSGQQTHYYDKIGHYQISKFPKQTPATRSAIVVFATRRAAADAAQTNYARFQQSWKTSRAAEPDAVNWPSLSIKGATVDVRKLISFISIMLLTFFWIVPVTFLQGLANLEELSELPAFSWLVFVNNLPVFIKGLISGYLPPLILAVFLSLIPVFIRLLVGIQRQHALGTVDALQRNYYFNFLLFSNLIFVALSGSIITYLRQLIDDPGSIVTLLASSIPVQSTFMINFILLLALSQVPLSLLQLGRWIVRWIFRKFLCKTIRQLRNADDGGCFFQYFRFYAWGMIVSTMALVYSTIAPLIVAAAALYFFTSYWVNKYCLLYTIRNPYESGGKLLKGAFTGIMIGLLLKQIVMAGVLSLKKQPVPAALEGILILLTVSFMYFIYTNYMRVAKHGSVLQVEESVEREGVPDMAADWIPPAYVSPGFKPLPVEVPNLNGVDDVNEEAFYADDVELAKIKATKKAANLEELSDEFMPAVGEPMPVTNAFDDTVPVVVVPAAGE
eukprot:TRINITY_DN292_c0_g1_i5.p1 TRINITY_DN292_c0_g1~~TRINITY_DN292_c0_g1_i5.p1  ORF type:complete len:799 (-),score=236.19 TRINITY_DN292_c0_g1_i5:132-2528(-)